MFFRTILECCDSTDKESHGWEHDSVRDRSNSEGNLIQLSEDYCVHAAFLDHQLFALSLHQSLRALGSVTQGRARVDVRVQRSTTIRTWRQVSHTHSGRSHAAGMQRGPIPSRPARLPSTSHDCADACVSEDCDSKTIVGGISPSTCWDSFSMQRERERERVPSLDKSE